MYTITRDSIMLKEHIHVRRNRQSQQSIKINVISLSNIIITKGGGDCL